MMKRTKRMSVLASALTVATFGLAQADEPGAMEEIQVPSQRPAPQAPPPRRVERSASPSDSWFTAIGVGFKPDHEGSNDYEARPAGAFKYTWGGDSLRFIELGGAHGSGSAARFRANVVPGGEFLFGPVVQLRRRRRDVDNNFVNRMPTVDMATEVGGFIGYKYRQLTGEVTGATDITRTAKSGATVELKVGYDDRLSDRVTFGTAVSSTYASDDYMQTYFGVNATQSAQSGLPTFGADDGFKDVALSMRLGWRPNGWDHWGFMALGQYARLIGDADDSSPITDVGDENQFFGGLMLTYQN